MVEGMRIAAIRIRTEEYEPIVKDFRKSRLCGVVHRQMVSHIVSDYFSRVPV